MNDTCSQCQNWQRLQPNDETAPEGHCILEENPGHWPFGYWPSTLARDTCDKGFRSLERKAP